MLDLKKRNRNEKFQPVRAQDRNGANFNSNIWKSYLFHIFIGFQTITGLIIPFFMTWGKLTFVEIMILQSYCTVMIFIFEIPCGAIADYLSRKLSLTLGAISLTFSALIYGSVPNVFIFMIGETFFAFGEASFSGTVEALLFDSLKKKGKENEISTVMGKTNTAFLIGLMIAAPFGSILALYMPIQYTFTFMSIPFAIAIFFSLMLKEPNQKLKKHSDTYITIIKSGLIELKRNKILRVLAFDEITVETIVFFLIWTYQLYLEALSVPIAFYGFVASGLTIIQMIFINIVPRVEKRASNKKILLTIYTLIPGIAFILMAVIKFLPINITLILIVIGFGLSRQYIYIRGINNRIETENRATILSTIRMIGSILRSILYPLIGLLVSWNLMFTFVILGATIITLTALSRVKNEYL